MKKLSKRNVILAAGIAIPVLVTSALLPIAWGDFGVGNRFAAEHR